VEVRNTLMIEEFKSKPSICNELRENFW
jgi:hypothetical protein